MFEHLSAELLSYLVSSFVCPSQLPQIRLVNKQFRASATLHKKHQNITLRSSLNPFKMCPAVFKMVPGMQTLNITIDTITNIANYLLEFKYTLDYFPDKFVTLTLRSISAEEMLQLWRFLQKMPPRQPPINIRINITDNTFPVELDYDPKPFDEALKELITTCRIRIINCSWNLRSHHISDLLPRLTFSKLITDTVELVYDDYYRNNNFTTDFNIFANAKNVNVNMTHMLMLLDNHLVFQNVHRITRFDVYSFFAIYNFFGSQVKDLTGLQIIHVNNSEIWYKDTINKLNDIPNLEEIHYTIQDNYHYSSYIVANCLEIQEKTKVRRFVMKVASTYSYHIANIICDVLQRVLKEPKELIMTFDSAFKMPKNPQPTPLESLNFLAGRYEYYVFKALMV